MKDLLLTNEEYQSLLAITTLTPDGLTAVELLKTEFDLIVKNNTSDCKKERDDLKRKGKVGHVLSVTPRQLDHVTKLAVAGTTVGHNVLKKLVGIVEDTFPYMLAPFDTMFPSIPKQVTSGSQMFVNLVGLASEGIGRKISCSFDTDGSTALGDGEVWFTTLGTSGTVTGYITVPTVTSTTEMTFGVCQSVRVDKTARDLGYAGEDPMQWLAYDKIKIRVVPA